MDPLLDGRNASSSSVPTFRGIGRLFTSAVRLDRHSDSRRAQSSRQQTELRVVREDTGSEANDPARTLEQENRALVTESLMLETSALVEDGELDIQGETICSRRGFIAITIFFLVISCLVAMLFMYCQGWWALLVHGRDPCDVPLSAWLTFYLLFLPTDFFFSHRIRPWAYRTVCCWIPAFPGDDPPLRVRALQFLYFFMIVQVYSIGLTMLASSKTCVHTAPELYTWVQHWLSFGLLLWFLFYTFAACGLLILQSMIAGGLWKTNRAAHPDTVINMETVAYDPDALWDGEEGRPAKECCICMEKYGDTHEIKRTPCKHVFHATCIKNWLKTQRTCPLCRIDLQEALTHQRPNWV